MTIIAFPAKKAPPIRVIDDQRDEVKALCALMSRRVQMFRAGLYADERAINEACEAVQITIGELSRMIEL